MHVTPYIREYPIATVRTISIIITIDNIDYANVILTLINGVFFIIIILTSISTYNYHPTLLSSCPSLSLPYHTIYSTPFNNQPLLTAVFSTINYS